ncbi:VCBS repeat-containing protein [Azospirillum fermentarium]|uniref:hypothetical protein n=1 Tax=Azospirillum fermentarium TaxID=1233114 RepID=UPI0022268985|nr:hypothetical protein [Azospirillum fermentarium]MCW2245689.1 VCBS repeat-containing protein [Azospirillum fermentarium]
MVALSNISTVNYTKLKGTTSQLSSRGMPVDYQQFTVSKNGEFNFKVNETNTAVKITDQNNKVVAEFSSSVDAASASAKLAPGTYTAQVEQKIKGVKDRAYSLEITPRENPVITAGGGMIKGTARKLEGNDSGVQKHGLNVVQGGTFTFNLSMPNARWAVMDKDNKVVASGDTMSKATTTEDILKKPSAKLQPGQYSVVIVQDSKIEQETPFSLQLVPKVEGLAAPAAQERPIDKTLRERDARLKQWAAQSASTTKNPNKLTLAYA